MTDLGTLGGSGSYAFGINDAGAVTGYAQTVSGMYHAFLYNGSGMQDLGTLGGRTSLARAINATGQVVGTAETVGNATLHAFLYSGGVMTDLGTLGGDQSQAFGINSLGQVVGTATTVANAGHAFLYGGGVMSDLNDLIDPKSGWTIIQGSSINDLGDISGYGCQANGTCHALLLDLIPSTGGGIPEPGSLALMGLGLAGAGIARRKASVASRGRA